MLLIHDVVVIMVDPTRRIVTDAAIAIDGERIVAIGKSAALGQRFAAAERIEGRGMIAIPGLIDTHGHADQSLLRGLGDGRHWMPFLDDIVEPYLRERDPADAVVAYELSGIEMLLAGTTCFVSPNVDARDDLAALAAVVERLGIRAVFARWTAPLDEPARAARMPDLLRRDHARRGYACRAHGDDRDRDRGEERGCEPRCRRRNVIEELRHGKGRDDRRERERCRDDALQLALTIAAQPHRHERVT
jgi:cytosine/adenosine deaminase-related metal-dependent hydrolase